MLKTFVYQGDSLLGEADIYPQNSIFNVVDSCNKEIRISSLSPQSERCPPLAVLHTISSSGLCFKMEFKPQSELESPLLNLYNTCLRENKTAVVSVGQEELHLVAMPSRRNLQQFSCFWGFNIPSGLYNSCLVMLNLRCLGIVFDLDETLIVANTMRSFEDRIDALQRKINSEMDPQRVSGMLAEVKRYQDDKAILKQYVENDQVVENGKMIKVQSEIVQPLSDNHQPIVRPLIRLQERNIILTRINPVIRDTSVLVRLRPAWEDLRSYLTARGRKRFEVYVCTMAERDYALEMWRLLDPESHLISSKELLYRVVCVKAGSKKSLFNVFQDGICHPKMAMVIDDRLKVWDDKDQPRVHVVPAFAPYYAPQAEANNAVPVLCVARNVACNVRGGFFKEFDEGLLQRIPDVLYEDDMTGFPSAPDVSSYLLSEEDASASSGNNPLFFDGMADAEVERRLKDVNYNMQTNSNSVSYPDPRPASSLPHVVAPSSNAILHSTSQGSLSLLSQQSSQAISLVKPLGHVTPSESCLQASPAREEGEVPESELDPDTRRRLLILQHGQDTREHSLNEPPFPLRPPVQIPVPPAQSRGGWFPLDEEPSPRQLIPPQDFSLEPEALHFDKQRSHHSSLYRGLENPVSFDRALNNSQRLPKEIQQGDDRFRQNHPHPSYSSFQGGRVTSQYSETPAGALQEIAMKCGTKVEFKPILNSLELQFSVEVCFTGEKIGEGIGRTRKEAQHQAAESSLKNLANKYLSHVSSDPGTLRGDLNTFSHINENGVLGDSNSSGTQPLLREDPLPITSTSEQSSFLDQRLEGPKRSQASVSALKELCTMEGLTLVFQDQSPSSMTSIQKGEVYAQIEVSGQVLGKGIGSSWEEARLQAAEEALTSLRSSLGPHAMKHLSSPRSPQAVSNKRLKPEFPQGFQRIPSVRYSKNGPPVP